MTIKEKVRSMAVAKKIKNGDFGEWSEETQETILKQVKEEYNLTTEMCDYIIMLLDGENKN